MAWRVLRTSLHLETLKPGLKAMPGRRFQSPSKGPPETLFRLTVRNPPHVALTSRLLVSSGTGQRPPISQMFGQRHETRGLRDVSLKARRSPATSRRNVSAKHCSLVGRFPFLRMLLGRSPGQPIFSVVTSQGSQERLGTPGRLVAVRCRLMAIQH